MQLKTGAHFTFGLAFLAIITRVWVAEDAYISFRVIENLFDGYGLVYNPGERIEAFTHPLWALILIVIRGIGIPLHTGSIVVGGGLVLLGLALLIYDKNQNNRLTFPFAALSLIVISGFRDFATGGMEFSLVFFLLVLFFGTLDRKRLTEEPALFASLLSMLYLARPEFGLALAWYSLFFAGSVTRKVLAREIGGLAAFRLLFRWGFWIVLIAGSYHLFRFLYYGDVFANTYYAKAGLSSYYSQGFKYLLYTAEWAPSLILLVILLKITVWSLYKRRYMTREDLIDFMRDSGITLVLILYVVRVGGDFMAFRFLLPEITMTALLFHHLSKKNPDLIVELIQIVFINTRNKKVLSLLHPKSLQALFYAFYTLLLFWPVPFSKGFVAEERRVYMRDMESTNTISLLLQQNHPWGRSGLHYRNLQRCLMYDDFWIANSQAYAKCMQGVGLGYFGVNAGPGVKIYDEQGIPNRDVAIQPVLQRFRPGHEHQLSLDKVIHKGVLFCSTGEPAYDRAMKTKAGIVIRLDPDLLSTLPDIRNRLKKLVELKQSGSGIIPRLERRYHVTVESLLSQSEQWESDPVMRSLHTCWDDFPDSPDPSFY